MPDCPSYVLFRRATLDDVGGILACLRAAFDPTVEVGAALNKLDDVQYRLARDHVNEGEKGLRREALATIEDREAHAQSFR